MVAGALGTLQTTRAKCSTDQRFSRSLARPPQTYRLMSGVSAPLGRPFSGCQTPRTSASVIPLIRLIVFVSHGQVRLGKGGRGSLFVFTRGGPAETSLADEWEVYAAESAR